jgi:hypothetical protein
MSELKISVNCDRDRESVKAERLKKLGFDAGCSHETDGHVQFPKMPADKVTYVEDFIAYPQRVGKGNAYESIVDWYATQDSRYYSHPEAVVGQSVEELTERLRELYPCQVEGPDFVRVIPTGKSFYDPRQNPDLYRSHHDSPLWYVAKYPIYTGTVWAEAERVGMERRYVLVDRDLLTAHQNEAGILNRHDANFGWVDSTFVATYVSGGGGHGYTLLRCDPAAIAKQLQQRIAKRQSQRGNGRVVNGSSMIDVLRGMERDLRGVFYHAIGNRSFYCRRKNNAADFMAEIMDYASMIVRLHGRASYRDGASWRQRLDTIRPLVPAVRDYTPPKKIKEADPRRAELMLKHHRAFLPWLVRETGWLRRQRRLEAARPAAAVATSDVANPGDADHATTYPRAGGSDRRLTTVA